jgi:hypothetical protein
MQMVYGGVIPGSLYRWWRLQDEHYMDPAGGHEPLVLGEIAEPHFDFFPANDARFHRWELLEIYGFCQELENRFKTAQRKSQMQKLKARSEKQKQQREITRANINL